MNSPSSAPPRPLGQVGGAVAEALAWLNSPAAIAGEVRRLEAAILAGDETEAARALLADWRAAQTAQRRLVAAQEETR